ncbi:aminodeoxychorismate synthase component I [Rhizobacter sp. AJA081-3]|uniref:aminodeoxychorismate synthase component I n=1 Tax=Rhizobacter sp. AJA081-3 TaxID=2753607 RepID=UPI001ADF4F28|nr:aminodeoxychorismate synthase component I [Rhizobacter sp. AJA081-3]QTN25945.1 aminodeoxychorismate synthase component I [Rhizobacter sp. AJA081-3]
MVCALLDDRDATESNPTSRLYTGFVSEHRCADPATLDATWAAVEADQRAGLHALLLADYEWGARLLKAGHEGLAPADHGALRVLMFERCERMSHAQAGLWLTQQPEAGGPAGAMHLQPSVDRAEFTAAIARIHEAIAAGETYQVNYTYRLHGRMFGSPLALYRLLRERQPVAYGAYIVLPEGGDTTHVLSCSPELFVRGEGGVVTARPMKGTASRITAPEGDSETARMLSLDIKNRAENLMIVDLLRNDLGRIAQIGSVKVPELFAVEPYSTVFQMTSTVQARLRPEIGFAELLRAVFPCGSITGAPKHHTMQLIAGLESTPRGLYCGAIGWLDAPRGGQRCGDFCLSVAIRTITLGAAQHGARPLRLGVGAGIVKDSRADDEFDECRLKARFLTGLAPGFELFETVLCTVDGALPWLTRHLDRLARSAAALGFGFDRDAARARLEATAAEPGDAPRRLRLALAHDGRLTLTQSALAPLQDGEVVLRIAGERLPDANPLAAHKTTLRARYDAGLREAERLGAFDSLFFSESGWLVEGGRSSVFVKLQGRWYTPPLADGALPGVMRAVLLDDAAFGARERRLSRGDLERAQAVMVCNALRGVLPARLLHTDEVT